MTFPVIETIDDVLPFIEGFDEIIVMEKEGYKVIDYVYQSNDTFNHPMRLECRGLIFDNDGKLIRRPFEKFFNYGEKDTFQTVDWSKNHIVMDKRDGSMIAAFMLDGKVRFGTRAGITDHSLKAEERHMTNELESECSDWIEAGYTPIFEWTAPDNRIVLDYEKSELRLLAIRHMTTGKYAHCDGEIPSAWTNPMGIKFVDTFDMIFTAQNITNLKETEKNIEGYVVYFPHNGERIKIKTDEYSQMHRAVSYFHREDMILPTVLDQTYDDILPSLSVDRKEKLETYAAKILEEFEILSKDVKIKFVVWNVKFEGNRKEFALCVQKNADKRLMPVFFRLLDGADIKQVLRDTVLKHPDLLETRWQL